MEEMLLHPYYQHMIQAAWSTVTTCNKSKKIITFPKKCSITATVSSIKTYVTQLITQLTVFSIALHSIWYYIRECASILYLGWITPFPLV